MTGTPEWVRNAKVGDKVVCIKPLSITTCPLVLNSIYEISGFYIGDAKRVETGKIVQCDITLKISGLEYWDKAFPFCVFFPSLFRPVQTTNSKSSTKTGMETLNSILASGKLEQEVDA